jgi:hypothetical protein
MVMSVMVIFAGERSGETRRRDLDADRKKGVRFRGSRVLVGPRWSLLNRF